MKVGVGVGWCVNEAGGVAVRFLLFVYGSFGPQNWKIP